MLFFSIIFLDSYLLIASVLDVIATVILNVSWDCSSIHCFIYKMVGCSFIRSHLFISLVLLPLHHTSGSIVNIDNTNLKNIMGVLTYRIVINTCSVRGWTLGMHKCDMTQSAFNLIIKLILV